VTKVHAVITAAGSSRRMGELDKLTLPLNGLPLLVRTLQPFLSFPRLGYMVVAVNQDRIKEFQDLFQEHLAESSSKVVVTAGGEHRQESILKALRLLQSQPEVTQGDPVMIHDGARPFVTSRLFESLLGELAHFDGVIPALPVRDTIKRVEHSSVLGTEDRETLRLVQTPQVFGLHAILELHEKARQESFLGTDDASLLEKYGRRVGWVEGPHYNLKVTVPEDITLLNHLFQQSQGE
jgi:2-C-methyl-D-erythritol 4-phosphate cytidylyltransferase